MLPIFRNELCESQAIVLLLGSELFEEMFKVSLILRSRTRQGDPVISSSSHLGTSCICLSFTMAAEQKAHLPSTLAMIDMAGIARDNG